MSSSKPKIYLDTNILVYHLMGKPQKLAQQSGRLLLDIEKGRYTGTITTWTRTEFLGVVKTFLAQSNNRNPSTDEMLRAEKMLTDLISELGLELQDADVLASQAGQTRLFAESDKILRNSSAVQRTDGRWTAIGGADSIHCVLAQRSGAQELATFDEDFRGISIQGVRTLIVRERY